MRKPSLWLAVIGALLLIVGVAVWSGSARAFDAYQSASLYVLLTTGRSPFDSDMSSNQVGVGVGVAIVLVSVVLLIAAAFLERSRQRSISAAGDA
ncbi:hypothetical protein [Microbacterium sp. CJ88]|uniref:hypothetical protein n=1 Tax=Microbacterium sp. CJ88 TaxID=3445672 RepID=UPI003F65A954